jgi:hypothetical protein
MNHVGKYIRIEQTGSLPRTLVWSVFAKEGGYLAGTIRWYGAWRKYAFMPEAGTVFEEVCLAEIGQFIAARTAEHRSKAA